MVLLFALKIFIAAWKWALRASRRFSLRTLRTLTACSLLLFVLSCWGWYEAQRVDEEMAYRFMRYERLPDRDFMLGLEESVTYYSLSACDTAVSFNAYMMAPAEGYARPHRTYDPLDIGKHFRREVTNFVQVSAPERTDFKHTILFWLSLIGLIVSPISTIATLLFTWITLHRRRAEELLMRLELEKRRLEIEQLRLELERARKEREESNAASPKIVLLS